MRLLPLFVALVFAGLASPHVLPAAEQATVLLASGREFTGFIDESTDDRFLVLRFERERSELRRTIDWKRVERAVWNDRELTSDELREFAPQLASRYESVWPKEAPSPSDRRPEPPDEIPPPPAPQVAAINVDATLGHWKSGVEYDGLLLRLTAVDLAGSPVAVEGTYEAELIAVRQAAVRGKYNYWRGEPTPQIGRWTGVATGAQTTGRLAIRLPFQAVQPEFRQDLAPHGLLHVRLTVPGQGVFDATVDLTRIRRFSPVRDRALGVGLPAFFPQERTTRSGY